MKDYSGIPEEHQQIMVEAVRITASSLDEHIPNWIDLINWDEFVFVNYKECIRGQLNRNSDVSAIRMSEVVPSGFDVPREVQSNYPGHHIDKAPEQLLRESLWSFMQDEWRKIAKKDLTTAA
jgi:hypothetical protein